MTEHEATGLATYRTLRLRQPGQERPQKRMGILWRRPGGQWHFTSEVDPHRGYPDDAMFVPVWADCESEGE
jgi:hypothetical protein